MNILKGMKTLKLIIATIDRNDEHNLLDKLSNQGYMATRMASEGGFLGKKNVTIYIGLEKEKLNDALDIIRKCCKLREPVTLNYTNYETSMGYSTAYPVNEQEGGAIFFVIDIDRFEKI